MIHSRPDAEGKAKILKRANVCLALYWSEDRDESVKAGMLESFVRVLSSVPAWAALRGFDDWEAVGTHRPSPAHIRQLAEARLKAVTDERAARARRSEAMIEVERVRLSPERAAEIMIEAGFKPRRMGD